MNWRQVAKDRWKRGEDEIYCSDDDNAVVMDFSDRCPRFDAVQVLELVDVIAKAHQVQKLRAIAIAAQPHPAKYIKGWGKP